MSIRRFVILQVLTAVVAFGSFQVNAAEQVAGEKFTAVYNQWEELNAQLKKLVEEFRSAKPERQAEIRKQFEGLSGKAKDLQPKLRTVALAAYTESPNQDQDVTDVLVGVASNDVHLDDYAAASEILDLLAKNDCKEDGLDLITGVVAYSTQKFDVAEKHFKLAKQSNAIDRQAEGYLSQIDQIKKAWATELELRAKEAKADDLPRVSFKTTKGEIVIELFENEAPQAVGNFVSLVEKKFYDGLVFHRVLSGFMAQGGCPQGTGTGGPGYDIYCECYKENYRRHFAGTLSMAHAGRDSGGSQFFLVFRPTPHLDGKHTAFGRIIKGMDVLVKLERINPQARSGATPDKIVQATVLRKRDHEYQPTIVGSK